MELTTTFNALIVESDQPYSVQRKSGSNEWMDKC